MGSGFIYGVKYGVKYWLQPRMGKYGPPDGKTNLGLILAKAICFYKLRIPTTCRTRRPIPESMLTDTASQGRIARAKAERQEWEGESKVTRA